MATTTMNEVPFKLDDRMSLVYNAKSNVQIWGAWGRDVGTMERRLKLLLVYPDGEISPIREYPKRKLTSPKALSDLVDMDGIDPEEIDKIYEEIIKQQKNMQVQADSSGKCSPIDAYRELCEYVQEYMEPGKVFVRDGYGNILSKYLQTVLDKLELGYNRLEMQKNFKAFGLLRANNGTGHLYAYRIVNDWYFSFKLPDESEVAA